MRSRRSSTRCLTGSRGFSYGAALAGAAKMRAARVRTAAASGLDIGSPPLPPPVFTASTRRNRPRVARDLTNPGPVRSVTSVGRHEGCERLFGRAVDHQQLAGARQFEDPPHRTGPAQDHELAILGAEQPARPHQGREAGRVEERGLQQVDHEHAGGGADLHVERRVQRVDGIDVDLTADGDPGDVGELRVPDLEQRHRLTKKSSRATIARANRSGCTITPPAMAMIKSTITKMSHSTASPLSGFDYNDIAGHRRSVSSGFGRVRRRADVGGATSG